MTKTYSELVTIPTFEERLKYLMLSGTVAGTTFGSRRWLNQRFYHSPEWMRFRDRIILRDSGRDLAAEGHDIYGPVLIHHLNPITYDDILEMNPCVFDPDNAVCTMLATHNAIHYGDQTLAADISVERTRNDTCPWKK